MNTSQIINRIKKTIRDKDPSANAFLFGSRARGDNYLKEAQKQTKDQAELTSHLRKIIQEDRELLEKLAQ